MTSAEYSPVSPETPVTAWLSTRRDLLEEMLTATNNEVAECQDANDKLGILRAQEARDIVNARLSHLLELELETTMPKYEPQQVLEALGAYTRVLSATLVGQSALTDSVESTAGTFALFRANAELKKTRAKLEDTQELINHLSPEDSSLA